jgi:ABC-type transporter Mla subunit MlaD
MSATNTGNDTGDSGRDGRIPEQVAQQAADLGRAVGNAVGPKAEDIADRSKAAGAEAVAGVARTAKALADTVAPDSPAIADYVRGAGQKIDRLANDLREKKVGDLLTSAAEFGRSQPVIMLAGAAIVGFALSRLVKAGVANPPATAPTEPAPVNPSNGGDGRPC